MLKFILNDSESDGSRSRTESVHNDESGSEIHEDKGSEQGDDDRGLQIPDT